MAKKSGEESSQADKIRQMIDKIGWETSPGECVKFMKDTFGIEMTKAYVSQLRSSERKRQGLPPLRIRKGSKARGKKVAAKETVSTAVEAPSSAVASAEDITLFVLAVSEWQNKLGNATIKQVFKTVVK